MGYVLKLLGYTHWLTPSPKQMFRQLPVSYTHNNPFKLNLFISIFQKNPEQLKSLNGFQYGGSKRWRSFFSSALGLDFGQQCLAVCRILDLTKNRRWEMKFFKNVIRKICHIILLSHEVDDQVRGQYFPLSFFFVLLAKRIDYFEIWWNIRRL